MTNIEKHLLSNTYPNLDIDLMSQIIEATPNPQLTIEILCGIYKKPEIPRIIIDRFDFITPAKLTFVSYDMWTNRVKYKWTVKESKGSYFPATVNKEDITIKNFDSLRCSWKEGAHYVTVDLNKTKDMYSTMGLDRWIKLHNDNPIDSL